MVIFNSYVKLPEGTPSRSARLWAAECFPDPPLRPRSPGSPLPTKLALFQSPSAAATWHQNLLGPSVHPNWKHPTTCHRDFCVSSLCHVFFGGHHFCCSDVFFWTPEKNIETAPKNWPYMGHPGLHHFPGRWGSPQPRAPNLWGASPGHPEGKNLSTKSSLDFTIYNVYIMYYY